MASCIPNTCQYESGWDASGIRESLGKTVHNASVHARIIPYEQLPANLKQKLDKLDLSEYYDILYRNLSVLISQSN